MKFLLIILFSLLFFTCKKGGYGDYIGSVQIHFVDNTRRDLFTNGTNGYYFDSVKVFDFQNNTKTLITPLNWSWAGWAASTLDISDGHGSYNIINGYSIVLIHLKAGVEDTLRGHFLNSDGKNNLYDSVWYNGILKYKVSSMQTNDTFTVIKN